MAEVQNRFVFLTVGGEVRPFLLKMHITLEKLGSTNCYFSFITSLQGRLGKRKIKPTQESGRTLTHCGWEL